MVECVFILVLWKLWSIEPFYYPIFGELLSQSASDAQICFMLIWQPHTDMLNYIHSFTFSQTKW